MGRGKRGLAVFAICVGMVSCGGGGGSRGTATTATAVAITGSPATDGVFDAAPAADGSGVVWMSHSIVLTSPHSSVLNQVRTRVARSDDAGATWQDVGSDPNNLADPDAVAPDGKGGITWATWRFEVSRLIYDPYDADPGARWKLVWHRMLAAVIDGEGIPIPANSWIGYASAASPTGPWSAERKLFAGSLYNPDLNAFIGAPEWPLANNFPLAGQLGNCEAFTEPGLLARADGLYVSLQCGGGGKVVLLRCDRAFSSCSYLGDLLVDSEAAQFSLPGQPIDAFAATELVEIAGTVYLIVTGHEKQPDMYRGCLVFRVGDLGTASVERANGHPVLVKRVAGRAENFNGACGYDAGAGASGIIYSEFTGTTTPRFHLFASRERLP